MPQPTSAQRKPDRDAYAQRVGRAHLALAAMAGLNPADDTATTALRWTTLRLIAAQLVPDAQLADFDGALELTPTADVTALLALPADVEPGLAAGDAMQYLLAHRLERDADADGGYRLTTLRGSRRKTSGSFYTPPALIALLMRSVRAVADAGPEPPIVLDPAMGVGHCLVAAAREIAGPDGDLAQVIRSRIYGVDLDPQAVALARVVLASLAPGLTPADLRDQLRVGNSLLGVGLDGPASARDADRWTARVMGLPVAQLASFRPLHWRLAFPHIAARGGFDVVIGNPPWERTALEAREYFAGRHAAIGDRHTTARRDAAIAALRSDAPDLHAAWTDRKTRQAALTRFYRQSERFALGARGRVNTYALFADLARQLTRPGGRWQLILPTGVVMDSPMRTLWQALARGPELIRLADFENTDALFPDVHREQRFCLLEARRLADPTAADTPSPEPASGVAQFQFWLRRPEQVDSPDGRAQLSPADFALLSPNSGQPIPFRSAADLALLRHIYRRCEPLWHEPTGRGQAQAFVAMTSAAWSPHCRRDPGSPDAPRRPLYEAKLIHQYDPAYASYRPSARRGDPPDLRAPDTPPTGIPRPRLWMDPDHVQRFLDHKARDRSWLLAYRDVTNVNNARSTIAAVLPATGLLQPLNGIHTVDASTACRVLAVLNSFACDYVARQRITGRHLNVGCLHQLPLPPPDAAWPVDPIPLVRELSYAIPELAGFARELGHHGPPAAWDPARRRHLRCRLDAAILHLYLGPNADWRPPALTAHFPTPRHAAVHILHTFPLALKRDPELADDLMREYDQQH